MKAKPVALYPHMVAQWDFEKNKERGLDINLTPAGLKVDADWKCKKCGYEWTAKISTRKESKGYCPRCDKDKQGPKTKTTISDVPLLMKYWDPDNEIDPTKVTATKNVEANWLCPDCGYRWKAKIHTKYYDKTGCPACSGKVASNKNNLFSLCPEAQKWTKEDLSKYTPQSQTVVHWKCPTCGYECDQPIVSKIRKTESGYRVNDCSECTGYVLHGTYADRYPELAAMYSDRNDKKFEELTAKDRETRFIWHCDTCGNDFASSFGSMHQIVIKKKSEHKGCPYCLAKEIPRRGESFADLHPKEAAQCIDDIDLHKVKPNSRTICNWHCDNGHEWQASISQRHTGWGDCPICNCNRPIKGVNTLGDIHPKTVDLWSASNTKSPFEYVPESTDWIKIICPDCKQERSVQVKNMFTQPCPYCNNKKPIPGVNTIDVVYPELLVTWDYEKNKDTPENLLASRNGRYWHACSEGHSFMLSNEDYYVFIDAGRNVCPFCDHRKADSEKNPFAAVYPNDAVEWDYEKNELSSGPEYIFADSTVPYYWKCPEGHSYQLSPADRIKYEEAGRSACPYCDDRMVMPGLNSLYAKHKEDIDNEWDWINNSILEVDPDQISESYDKKVWWNCSKGHCYPMTPANWSFLKFRGREVICPMCMGRRRKRSHFARRKKK